MRLLVIIVNFGTATLVSKNNELFRFYALTVPNYADIISNSVSSHLGIRWVVFGAQSLFTVEKYCEFIDLVFCLKLPRSCDLILVPSFQSSRFSSQSQ